jgi:hypothetical protein
MLINFMYNDNFLIRPIVVGNNLIESISTYKLLGVAISRDLKWNHHVEHILKKANKRLYSLRMLKKAGVSASSIVKVYIWNKNMVYTWNKTYTKHLQ